MRIEEYQKHLEEMSEEELLELIQDFNRNRQTVTQQRIKAVKEKSTKGNLKSALSNLTEEEKAELIAKLIGG